MSKDRPRLGRLGVLAPAALSVCIDASVLAAPAAGAILSTVLKELSKAFMLKKWFHGVMTAEEAEHLLMQRGKNGSYLVRESQTHPGEFVLSVRVRGRVSHVMIRRQHERYHVGSGEVFDDLTGLIEHCRTYPLTETTGDVLRLLQPVNGHRMPADNTRDSQDVQNLVAMEVVMPAVELEKIATGGGTRGYPTVHRRYSREYTLENFDDEFRGLSEVEACTKFTNIEGNRRENRSKNRYKNVIPYDQTRVRLPITDITLKDEKSDYINASFIRPLKYFKNALNNTQMGTGSSDGPQSDRPAHTVASSVPVETTPLLSKAVPDELSKAVPDELSKAVPDEVLQGAQKFVRTDRNNESVIPPNVVKDKFYIATQGCLLGTIHSFWRMIVDNDVRVIVMVTNPVENGQVKCERYWPTTGERELFGDIEVQTIREVSLPDFNFREFEVVAGKNRTIVAQYQCKTWRDHRAPSDIESILFLVNQVNERMLQISNGENAPKKNILCVHCSAGVGRTGTFIALDMLIDQVKTEGENVDIDVTKTVKLCRYQRAGMVQNKIQYKFLYHAINKYIDESGINNNRKRYSRM